MSTAKEHLRHVLVGSGGVVRDSIALDRSKVLIWQAVYRAAVVTVLIVVAIALGAPHDALALGAGSLFVALAGEFQRIGRRWRLMLWTLLWITVGTYLGGIVSDNLVLRVVVSAVVALICGFVVAAGPGAGIAGLLTLVLFTVFGGIPSNPVSDLHTALLVALGGLVQFVAIVVPVLVRRPGAVFDGGEQPVALLTRLRSHLSVNDLMMRHGFRLAVAISIATVVASAGSRPNQYWIPMTVAWMTRPDAGGTVTRVVGRIIGTVGGVLVALVLIDVLGMRPNGYLLALIAGAGALLALIFIWAEYPLAVVGVTLFVIALLTLLGESADQSAGLRVVDTLIAGVITVACSFLWRPSAIAATT
ncbi:MAG: FUSC family protein [Actinobacteria bacterium]|nr:FUSC family protein [Actinomycetota bacterium]